MVAQRFDFYATGARHSASVYRIRVGPHIRVQAQQRVLRYDGATSRPRSPSRVVNVSCVSSQSASQTEAKRDSLPVWTAALILLNVVVFLLDQCNARNLLSLKIGDLTGMGAKVNSLVAQGEWWRLFTYTFLHGDWMHLGGNMLFLQSFRWLEQKMGALRFLCIFVFSALAAGLTSYYMHPGMLRGISGACCGLLAAAFVFHADNEAQFSPEQRRAGMQQNFLMILLNVLVFPLFFPLIETWAHVGGVLGGLVLSFLLGPRFRIQQATQQTSQGPREVKLLLDQPRIPVMANRPLEV